MDAKAILHAWLDAPATQADFDELYRRELPRIYNYFRFRVGDGPLAEDLTSDTFVKAWHNRRRYRRDLGAFSTWLFTIARRVAQDHWYMIISNKLSKDEMLKIADSLAK